jgi:hypothetical protein
MNIRPMAYGGVAMGPKLVGEGSWHEAVVPLPDGRSIPVTGGASPQVNLNIINNNGSQVSQTTRSDGTIEVMIDAAEQRMAGRFARGTGPLVKAAAGRQSGSVLV